MFDSDCLCCFDIMKDRSTSSLLRAIYVWPPVLYYLAWTLISGGAAENVQKK